MTARSVLVIAIAAASTIAGIASVVSTTEPAPVHEAAIAPAPPPAQLAPKAYPVGVTSQPVSAPPGVNWSGPGWYVAHSGTALTPSESYLITSPPADTVYFYPGGPYPSEQAARAASPFKPN